MKKNTVNTTWMETWNRFRGDREFHFLKKHSVAAQFATFTELYWLPNEMSE